MPSPVVLLPVAATGPGCGPARGGGSGRGRGGSPPSAAARPRRWPAPPRASGAHEAHVLRGLGAGPGRGEGAGAEDDRDGRDHAEHGAGLAALAAGPSHDRPPRQRGGLEDLVERGRRLGQLHGPGAAQLLLGDVTGDAELAGGVRDLESGELDEQQHPALGHRQGGQRLEHRACAGPRRPWCGARSGRCAGAGRAARRAAAPSRGGRRAGTPCATAARRGRRRRGRPTARRAGHR